MDQAQQPFEGENPAGIGGMRRQRPCRRQGELGLGAVPFDGDGHVRQQDGQEASQAPQRFVERAGAGQGADQQFETAGAHRRGEQAESFVVEGERHAVVQIGIGGERNAGFVACEECGIDPGGGEQIGRIASLASHAGQQTGDEADRDRGGFCVSRSFSHGEPSLKGLINVGGFCTINGGAGNGC